MAFYRLLPPRYLAVCILIAVSLVCGCSQTREQTAAPLGAEERKVFALNVVTPEQVSTFLSELELSVRSQELDSRALAVLGSSDEVAKAAAVIAVIDGPTPYVVKRLAPASMARTIPTNAEIANAVGITVGTFSEPPPAGAEARAIIDVHRESVIALMPRESWKRFVAVAAGGMGAFRATAELRVAPDRIEAVPNRISPVGPLERAHHATNERVVPPTASEPKPTTHAPLSWATVETPPADSLEERRYAIAAPQRGGSGELSRKAARNPKEGVPDGAGHVEMPVDARGSLCLDPARLQADVPAVYEPAPLDNGEDTLQLDLPDTLELIDLLDLAAQHLNLDYLYDPATVVGQKVSLKLHGRLRGEIRVKDLYPLLESVLKFKGLAMSRNGKNVVTVVPVGDALDADPDLLTGQSQTIATGDMVVTRVFKLKNVNTATACGLLEDMKLSVAVAPVEETQSVIVTCYAHRMTRIEQLLDLVDRPGRPKEFRFRQLKYAVAETVIDKIEALSTELQVGPVYAANIAPQPAGKTSGPVRKVARTSSATSGDERQALQPNTGAFAGRALYLDVDERTNRILMVGYPEELAIIDQVIDAMDLARQDFRVPKIYTIRNLRAVDVLTRLRDLEVVRAADAVPSAVYRSTSATPVVAYSTGETEMFAELPQATAIEPANTLLIKATEEQHAYLAMIINLIDATQHDLHAVRVYAIQHMDARDVKKKLEELRGTVKLAVRGEEAGPRETEAPPSSTPISLNDAVNSPHPLEPQIVVLETTNSLLVSAPEEQQQWMEEIISRIDTQTSREAIPYEIHFLENQDPEQLAEVLSRLVQETMTDKEGKIQEVINRTEDEVIIIPDAGTFSLIVYANRKNQEWVADLIKQLDKRRPQVLIDVTLVEINKTEAFTYDLDLIQSFPDLTATSGLTGTISGSLTSSDIMDRLSASGRSRFVDYQSDGGNFTGFYGDKHINLLLQAMQSKNYGRVLAKPKILVNDNQPGTIKTADTTYVAKRSSIPVSSGGAGNDATLIETAVDYQPYEAGITLNITPHISQGQLLRLDIELTRSDFRDTEDPEKPPDTTASELTTTVFVPDGSTIILGGLLKLNQNKGGVKVPLLGDIPLVGGLFRSIKNRDTQNKLYVFVKAEIIRPEGVFTQGMAELDAISQTNRAAFEQHEKEFQDYQDWPGLKPRPVDPQRVLEAR